MAEGHTTAVRLNEQPPYESPHNMLYPAHFDHSVKLITFADDDSALYAPKIALCNAIENLRHAKDMGFHVSVTQAVTRSAYARNARTAARSPVFIAIVMGQPYVDRINDIHQDVIDLVKYHYPDHLFAEYPGLATPIVRYFVNKAIFPGDGVVDRD